MGAHRFRAAQFSLDEVIEQSAAGCYLSFPFGSKYSCTCGQTLPTPHFSAATIGSNWSRSSLALNTFGGAATTGVEMKCTSPSIAGLGTDPPPP